MRGCPSSFLPYVARWKREQKWKGDIDETNDSNDPADLPKWKQEKKWKRNV